MSSASDSESERRGHRRHVLEAAIELRFQGEALFLPIRNISVSGALIGTGGRDLSMLKPGLVYEMVVFDPNETTNQALVSARIVRHSVDAMAVQWTDEDGSIWRVAEVLARL